MMFAGGEDTALSKGPTTPWTGSNATLGCQISAPCGWRHCTNPAATVWPDPKKKASTLQLEDSGFCQLSVLVTLLSDVYPCISHLYLPYCTKKILIRTFSGYKYTI